MERIFDVSKKLKFLMTSFINSSLCLLPGGITNLVEWITSSQMGISIASGA